MVKLLRALAQKKPAPKPVSDEIDFRLGVHDSTRLEWVASAMLPPDPEGERRYEIEFTLEVPAHIYTVHNCWDHKQTFTRLQSPSEEGAVQVERGDLDELRRDTLGVAHRLKTLRQKFERVCLETATLRISVDLPAVMEQLEELVAQAVDVVAEMRRHLARPPSENSMPRIVPEVMREWALADEFLSHQLLDLLGGAERALDQVLFGRLSMVTSSSETSEELRCLLAEALAEELVHRRARKYLNPAANSPSELAAFVERASRLKKHFHNVLFLDVEAYMVDYRLRNWTGVIAAALAAGFWLAFTLIPIGPGARAGIGLGTFAVVFAATYALKDRIKELARQWLAGRLVRLYGQRAVTLRLPQRIDAHRRVLVEVRETFDVEQASHDDNLNENVGRTRRMMVQRFRMKANVHGSGPLQRAGIGSIKHVFRYDLSPIFAKLDDAVKSVPILDEQARRVRFVEAPKEYRVHVHVIARRPNAPEHRVSADLVLSKRGIERLEAIRTSPA